MSNTHEVQGAGFVRSGFGMLILGMVMGLGVVGHYMVGARWDTGAEFLRNVGLWFGCPWTLSTSMVMVGAIGMIAMGSAYATLARLAKDDFAAASDLPRRLCKGSLVAIFLTGFIGYFVVDAFWPGFYYSPIKAGKEVWLSMQLLCMMGYLVGVILAFNGVRHLKTQPA
ncbi:hypothetical protein [Pseudomonas sp. NPDC089569]|uniref:hypothetical protein n=1 Tax=Pseudomonas sp. NPDC089569 TaxID=3390722 RepID=UPI003D02124C